MKSYPRYEESGTFGAISSSSSNSIYLRSVDDGQNMITVAAAINENFVVWDLRKSEINFKLSDPNCQSAISRICQSSLDNDFVATGYVDGSVRVWNIKRQEMVCIFKGHKSAITCLEFDFCDLRLCSGSQDTNIVVWDVIAEKGIAKLKGHSDQITSIQYLTDADSNQSNYIISTGKDSLIKVWDLNVCDCIETKTSSKGSIWSSAVVMAERDDLMFLTSTSGSNIQVWELSKSIKQDYGKKQILTKRGAFSALTSTKSCQIKYHSKLPIISVHCFEKSVEIIKVRSKSEMEKLKARRRKRLMKKNNTNNKPLLDDDRVDIDESDNFISLATLRLSRNIANIDWNQLTRSNKAYLLIQYKSNVIETYTISLNSNQIDKVEKHVLQYSLAINGHRDNIRSVALSENESIVASADTECLKMWDLETGNCLRTLKCDYVLSCKFISNDKFIFVSYRSGEVEIFNSNSTISLFKSKAHSKSCWAAEFSPTDATQLATCSSDKTLKIWSFQHDQKFSLTLKKTLELPDESLALKYSPNGKYIAVALLDNIVRIFHSDSCKYYLSLYGHNLPVLSIDISHDSKLIITSSADKNIKIWGLDFGDCHRSIFAHQDSILQLKFIPGTHQFISASKDGLLKYWDADNFQLICPIKGFHGEVWAFDIGKTTGLLVAASHDNTIRTWVVGQDDVFIEEERENEMEETMMNNIAEKYSSVTSDVGINTKESLISGEKIIQALEIGTADLKIMDEYKEEMLKTKRHPLLQVNGDKTASDFVFGAFEKLKMSQIEDSLIMLPLDNFLQLINFLKIWTQERRSSQLIFKILMFSLKTHYKQIISNKNIQYSLKPLREQMRCNLKAQKQIFGENIAGLRFIEEEIKVNTIVNFEDIESSVNKTKRSFSSLS